MSEAPWPLVYLAVLVLVTSVIWLLVLWRAVGRRQSQHRIKQDQVQIGGESMECFGCRLAQGPHWHRTEETLVFRDGEPSSATRPSHGPASGPSP